MKRGYVAYSLLAGVILFAASSVAQLQIGQNLKMALAGSVGTNYTADFADDAGSSHGISASGNANLSGYYFDPRFLSFTVSPYYGRSQASSSGIAIGTIHGVTGTAELFSGSRFPGSFTFAQISNGTGQFAIPGATALVTQANGHSFGVGWSLHFPGWPEISTSFNDSSGSSQILGLPGAENFKSRNFTVSSNGVFAGFALAGSFAFSNTQDKSPAVLTGSAMASRGTAQDFSFSASHRISRDIDWSSSFSHNSYDDHTRLKGDVENSEQEVRGSANYLVTSIGWRLPKNVQTHYGVSYQDNVLANVFQQVMESGAAPITFGLGKMRVLTMVGSAVWQSRLGFGIGGGASRSQQYFMGREYDTTQLSGAVNYGYFTPLLGSCLFNVSMFDTANKEGNQELGFRANLSFARKFRGFDVTGNASYDQNTQTVVSFVTSSGYSISAGVKHPFYHSTTWYGATNQGFTGFHSGGLPLHLQMYQTGIVAKKFNVATNVSRSQTAGVITPNGIVSAPGNVPTDLPGANFIATSSKTYGISAGYFPIDPLALQIAYNRSDSSSSQAGVGQDTRLRYVQANFSYQMRRISLYGTYTRVLQGQLPLGGPVVGAGLPSSTTYSFGLSRSFKFF